MDRRAFLSATAGLLAAPLFTEAHQVGKVYRIGVLAHSTLDAAGPLVQVFRQGLSELGYVEGKNVALEMRFAERQEHLKERAEELVRLPVDVIWTVATPASLAAKRATVSIPIVMAAVADPVQNGLVASLSRPGGNVTGNAALTAELTSKQLELLKEALPHVSSLAVLWNPTNPALQFIGRDSQLAARGLGIRVDSVEVRTADALAGALTAIAASSPGAVLIHPDPMLFVRRAQIADVALKHRLPTIALFKEFVVAGGLMSYGPSLPALVLNSTRYLDKILKGAKPADLPVEQPTKFELVINGKTATALGLTIPPSLLLRADQVIE
jgi:putative ABC transport system substrate-binding protein